MKRTLLCTILVLFVSISIASPVYPGIWHTVRLADGREIKVQAFGDERQHYWQGEDGLRYVKNPTTNLFEVLAETPQTSVAQGKRYTGNILQKNAQQISGATQAQTSSYVGQKKGLIILVEFPDQTFSMSDPKTFYDKVANLKGFNEQYFNGSVHDYFYAQSDGKFDLSFDVVGPVKVSQPYSYYGNDNEAKVPEMVREACIAINTQVDFSNYDWNKDGEVEEVFALYSGYGQADHPDDDKYIWPHMFW
ncbi:MAG: peptidase, partial [Prevotella sp.]|nr:peptidase [Prevotella sp.]